MTNARCACTLRELSHHQAHGAGAVDEVVLADATRQSVEAVNGARQRLDQRCVLHGHRIGQGVAVADRYGEELSAGAVECHAERAVLNAQVASSDRAVVALAAEDVGIRGDAVALGELGDVAAYRYHGSREFMPGMRGYGRYGSSPSTRWMSVPRMPHPSMATTTSRPAGVGS
jgi:hypothetical protein